MYGFTNTLFSFSAPKLSRSLSAFLNTVVVALFYTCDTPVVWAQSDSRDVAGSKDIAFLKRYEESFITDYSATHQSNYRVIKGGLEKVNGVWISELEAHASGSLTQVTYRIPDGYSTSQVRSFYLEQLHALQAEELFRCQGRACGSSVEWANGVFGVRRISGPDRNQEYRLYSLSHGGDAYLLALYINRRANQRVYAHLDLLLLDKPFGSTRPEDQGRVLVLPLDSLGSVKVADIRRVNRYIRSNPGAKLRLVGHVYGGANEPVEKLLERSVRYAEKLKQQLNDEHIVDAFGVGPLAPENSAQPRTDRIEVLRID